MERLITNIFKIAGCSLILLIMLDTGLAIFDIFTTLNKVQAVTDNMQMDIAKYNGLPSEDIRNMYAQKLADCTVNSSNVIYGVSCNLSGNAHVNDSSDEAIFDGDVTVSGGTTYTDLADLKDYGQMQTLFVGLKMNVFTYSFTGTLDSLNKKVGQVAIKYAYDVPCLNYTK